jgi:hypothetical protein
LTGNTNAHRAKKERFDAALNKPEGEEVKKALSKSGCIGKKELLMFLVERYNRGLD